MGPAQSTKLFAIAVALFGFYFFHCEEAKADTYSSSQFIRYHSDQRFESASLTPCKLFSSNQDFGKWILWSFIVPEGIEFVKEQGYSNGTPREFHLVGAKDFFIRTGLSPPLLIV